MPMQWWEMFTESENESMQLYYYETKEATVVVEGKVHYLPVGFWISFFLISMPGSCSVP